MSPSLTQYLTIPSLTKFWFLGVTIYLIRNTSKKFHFSPQKELFLYIAAGLIAVLWSRVWGSAEGMTMGREESELVKEYLYQRKGEESLGEYLKRVEGEKEGEEEMLHEKRRSKGVRGGNGKERRMGRK